VRRRERYERPTAMSPLDTSISMHAGGQIILETKTKKKNVPASRKWSSTLTPTRSSVNDASSSSRCSAPVTTSSASTFVYDQNASVGNCVSMIAGPTRQDGLSAVKTVIWSEMLRYIHFYRDKSNINALRQVVIDIFSASAFSKLRSLPKCSLDVSVRRLL